MIKQIDRIDCDANGQLDDLVLHNVETVRVERMSDSHAWMRFYLKGRKDVVVNFGLNKDGHLDLFMHEE